MNTMSVGIPKTTVIQTANSLYHYFQHEPDVLKAICETYRIRIVLSSDINREEMLQIHDKNHESGFAATIHLPFSTSPVRDRFTIAHELGHFFLHKDVYEAKQFNRGGSNRMEWEANWFAAELLMPTNQFLEAMVRYGDDIWGLAREFGVSHSAAEIRMRTINMAGL